MVIRGNLSTKIILAGCLIIILIALSSIFYSRTIIVSIKTTETFEDGSNKMSPDKLKEILKKANPTGEELQALQGAYEQFLQLHKDFCALWTPFLETGRDYEKQSSNETGNGGAAVGTGTAKEYVRLISLREEKTFVDCSVEFPPKLDVSLTSQQMPYESKAYMDSLEYGIKQMKKIQEDTKKALTNLPKGSQAPVKESFIDIISQNCEEKDGIIRCVLSIDSTNKNIKGRASERLVEILGAEQDIRNKMIEFKKEANAMQRLKNRAESGEIAADVKIEI